MDPLRLTLFSGLILHKVIWEILKKKGKPPDGSRRSSQLLHIRIIKLGKIAILIFILVQTLFLDILQISGDSETLRVVGLLIFLVGLITAILARLQLGENWIDFEEGKILPGHTLVTRGIYRFIRHPIYTGDVLLLIGLELALNCWLVLAALLLIPIIFRQAVREEDALMKNLPNYGEYCRYTKRFIPFII
jgi:protein-S-isoprenylcysteine O-methyltransferase Ste14